MKIDFTAFNNGQEHFVFDSDTLKEGEKLSKFIIGVDENGKIFILPMLREENCYYAGQILEKV